MSANNKKGNKGGTWDNAKRRASKIWHSEPVQFLGKVVLGTSIVGVGTYLGTRKRP